MRCTTWMRRGLYTTAMLAGMATLPLTATLMHAGVAAADAPAFPILQVVGEANTGNDSVPITTEIGTVQVLQAGSPMQVEVTLQGALANTTYTVSACGPSADGLTTACVNDPTSDTITTNADGNAQALLSYGSMSSAMVTEVTLSSGGTEPTPAVALTSAVMPFLVMPPVILPQ